MTAPRSTAGSAGRRSPRFPATSRGSPAACSSSGWWPDSLRRGLQRLQVIREELLHRGIELLLVFLVVEAVALVLLDDVLYLHAALPQRLDDLVALGLVDAR